MDHELFGSIVNGQPLRVNRSSGRFGQALEGNLGIGPGVLGLKDHAKGAMIEGSESSESPVKQRTFLEVVSHALHLMMISTRMGEAVVLPTVRDRQRKRATSQILEVQKTGAKIQAVEGNVYRAFRVFESRNS
jgi:hypothetical protein